jgi:hypothetical protein
MMSLRAIAAALGGEVSGNSVLAPGPGHSKRDRSLSVTPSPSAHDGFLVHSFCGDDPIACKDYVREKLGQPAFRSGQVIRIAPSRPWSNKLRGRLASLAAGDHAARNARRGLSSVAVSRTAARGRVRGDQISP